MRFARHSLISIFIIIIAFIFNSCEDFFNPNQDLIITEDELFDDWYEYRSVEMGLYALQNQLVEQIIILGELRADMLTITPNADADLIAIYNFNITKENKYASPTNFFKLISACNNLIHILQREHPEVIEPESPVTNYDRLYGEVICMRAWAYFNAVLIYGKVPYIHESLVTINEIEDFVSSTGTYIDSVYIEFGIDGYHNVDTILNKQIVLEKQLMDLDVVLDMFIGQLENDVKVVGVNHSINNKDISWEILVWNTWAWHALLGKLYMYQGDLGRAAFHFEKIMYNNTQNLRYQLDGTFSYGNWQRIFSTLDNTEHIFTLWFDKDNFQKNGLQDLFESRAPHNYMLKPSIQGLRIWEYSNDRNRGAGESYSFIKGGNYFDQLSESQLQEVRRLRQRRDYESADIIIEGYDTVVYKYSLGKGTFDDDAYFNIYRAAEIHLDLAEIYTYWAFEDRGNVRTYTLNALNILNDGSNYYISSSRPQMGVRGRVGLRGIDLNRLENGNLAAKQEYLDQRILEERGRELGFEGKRFYDLMRISKRLNNPWFLANKVAAKYPSGGKRNQIRAFLADENNWYIHYFD
ncbi:MAG: RagB/SusD family nutrient uptake outer membrane protein [Mariniphaga sp.]|nr:RagB/SusD family nutrient uptake outer membrane protein [Mariniphaga sp.]